MATYTTTIMFGEYSMVHLSIEYDPVEAEPFRAPDYLDLTGVFVTAYEADGVRLQRHVMPTNLLRAMDHLASVRVETDWRYFQKEIAAHLRNPKRSARSPRT